MSKKIFYVDSSGKCPDKIQDALEQMGINVSCFISPFECLDSIKTCECHLLLSGSELEKLDGIKFLKQVKQIIPSLPIVLLVNPGDIKTTVRAVKAGASDCFEKPIQQQHLTTIKSIVENSLPQMRKLNNTLSDIEIKVLHLILNGKTNKEIAVLLQRSERTIEVHRRSIMRKFNAINVVDLMRKSVAMGLLEI